MKTDTQKSFLLTLRDGVEKEIFTMYMRYLLAASVVVVSALLISPPSSAEETPGKEKIDKLIEQLGSGDFAERETASKEIAKIGVPALEALRKAAKSDDAEVRKRAEELLPKIERQAESARILAPKRLHLVYKDTPLGEAVDDLQKKSGYNIHLHDPDGKLKERKITLDSGATTFWRAFALFCDKAELSEASLEDLLQARRGGGALPAPPAVPRPGGAPPAPPAVPRPGGAPGIPVQPPRVFMLGMNQQLVLKDAKSKKLPTDDRSAVRIRALAKADLFGKVAEGEMILPLEVSLEPKLQWQTCQSIHLDKVVDDRDQTLSQVIPQVEGGAGGVGGNPPLVPPGIGGGQQIQIMQLQQQRLLRMQMQLAGRQRIGWGGLAQLVPVQLKKGAKDAKSLKELKGTLTVQLLAEARPVIVADKLDKAAGKTFKGDEGGSIKIVDVASEEKQTTIQLEFYPPPYNKVVPAQGNIFPGVGIGVGMPHPPAKAPAAGGKGQAPIRRGVLGGLGQPMNSMNGLSVHDDKGNALPIDATHSRMEMTTENQGNGRVRQTTRYTLVCPHDKDNNKPAKVVYLGRKSATVEIPFALKDVPLP